MYSPLRFLVLFCLLCCAAGNIFSGCRVVPASQCGQPDLQGISHFCPICPTANDTFISSNSNSSNANVSCVECDTPDATDLAKAAGIAAPAVIIVLLIVLAPCVACCMFIPVCCNMGGCRGPPGPVSCGIGLVKSVICLRLSMVVLAILIGIGVVMGVVGSTQWNTAIDSALDVPAEIMVLVQDKTVAFLDDAAVSLAGFPDANAKVAETRADAMSMLSNTTEDIDTAVGDVRSTTVYQAIRGSLLGVRITSVLLAGVIGAIGALLACCAIRGGVTWCCSCGMLCAGMMAWIAVLLTVVLAWPASVVCSLVTDFHDGGVSAGDLSPLDNLCSVMSMLTHDLDEVFDTLLLETQAAACDAVNQLCNDPLLQPCTGRPMECATNSSGNDGRADVIRRLADDTRLSGSNITLRDCVHGVPPCNTTQFRDLADVPLNATLAATAVVSLLQNATTGDGLLTCQFLRELSTPIVERCESTEAADGTAAAGTVMSGVLAYVAVVILFLGATRFLPLSDARRIVSAGLGKVFDVQMAQPLV
eukprot:TRINITY_DN6159_c0_g1_i1.p1 TRINITY_DN6159_c0_g1~~TRINITY_DN6159_c0_g1_i1.p1  ORF type:complete len:533 (+),score=123.78 TRINITY_DN6159_c0_g1_i1:91-1689(+)